MFVLMLLVDYIGRVQHVYKRKKKLNLAFLLVLTILLLPLTSAVNLESGTVLNTTGSNSSMTFEGCSIIVTEVDVTPYYVFLSYPTYIDSTLNNRYELPDGINWSTNNDNIDCSEFAGAYSIGNPTVNSVCGDFITGFMNIGGRISTLYTVLGILMVISVVVLLLLVIAKFRSGGISSFSTEGSNIPIGLIIGIVIAVMFFVLILILLLMAVDPVCSISV